MLQRLCPFWKKRSAGESWASVELHEVGRQHERECVDSATVFSSKPFELEFPYQGAQRARLTSADIRAGAMT